MSLLEFLPRKGLAEHDGTLYVLDAQPSPDELLSLVVTGQQRDGNAGGRDADRLWGVTRADIARRRPLRSRYQQYKQAALDRQPDNSKLIDLRHDDQYRAASRHSQLRPRPAT